MSPSIAPIDVALEHLREEERGLSTRPPGPVGGARASPSSIPQTSLVP